MKLVLDASAAAKWYLHDVDVVKALRFRSDFHAHLHELVAPDTLPANCADVLVQAERRCILDPGEAADSINDFVLVGVVLFSSIPLLPRAVEISLNIKLTFSASLYLALAEREQYQLLTADQKMLRVARKQFSFILPFASLP